jgi:hypothetical protein
LFKRKPVEAPAPPTSPVLIRLYGAETLKGSGKAKLASMSGAKNDLMRAVAILAEDSANELAQHGYRPVATSWNLGDGVQAVMLTVTYTKG